MSLPPVSAFYAEHYNKRVSLCGHIWTKSKFLGLSIGVHNIGQACVSVLDLDEEYILSFPSGYGRCVRRQGRHCPVQRWPLFEYGRVCSVCSAL